MIRHAHDSQPSIETLALNAPFGPFTQPIQLDIKPLTVFIGQQGTGKSLISQFLYFFQNIEYLFANFDHEKSETKSILKLVEAVRAGYKAERAFEHFIRENVHLIYNDLKQNKKELSFLKKYTIYPIGDFKKEIIHYLEQQERPSYRGHVAAHALFIPAERTFISHLINAAPVLLGSTPLSLATRHFIDFISVEVANIHEQWAKTGKQPAEAEIIANMVHTVLGGKAVLQTEGTYKKKWLFELLDQNTTITMEMASSGQMDTWPLITAVQAIFDPDMAQKPLFLHIEEPETHLHPKAQVDLVKMLAYLVNQGFRLVITTHSLIVLYTLNNLAMAYEKLQDVQTKESLPQPETRLNPNYLAAYLFDKGQIYNVFDQHQIDEALLESVLGELDVQQNKLMTYKVLWG